MKAHEAISGTWRWDIASGTVTWSEGLYQLFEVDPTEHTPTLDNYLAVVHPEDRSRVLERVQHTLQTGEPFQNQERVVLATGTQRVLLSSGELRLDEEGQPVAMYGVCMDITSMWGLQEALRNRETALNLGLEAGGVVSWSLFLDAPETLYLYSLVPQAACHGDAPSFPLAMEGFWRWFHEEDRALLRENLERLAQEGQGAMEQPFRLLLPEGGQRWFLARAHLLDEPGGRKVLRGVSIDINERKQLEERVAQFQRLESVSRLSRGVAHEFNNLLTVIRGELSLMRESMPPDSSNMESVGVLSDAVERARDITDKLLTFAQSHPSRTETVDLRFWVMDLRSFLERITGESVALHLHLPREPWPVRCDRAQLDQVLLNLAANARDAMPRGGELSIHLRRLVLDSPSNRGSVVLDAGTYICLECRDNGEGISPAAMKRVLEPFFTTRSRGSGLGLSTSYGILRSHRGALELESELGQGTTVRLYLPQSDQVALSPSSSGGLEELDPEDTAGAVMVVESEPAVRRFVGRVLRSHGYPVLEAYDGADALKKLEQRQGRIGMVLADLQAEQPRHLELIAQIKHRWPSTRLLIVSGFHRGELAHHPVLGKLPFLRKPFLPAQLIHTVRAAWKTQRRA